MDGPECQIIGLTARYGRADLVFPPPQGRIQTCRPACGFEFVGTYPHLISPHPQPARGQDPVHFSTDGWIGGEPPTDAATRRQRKRGKRPSELVRLGGRHPGASIHLAESIAGLHRPFAVSSLPASPPCASSPPPPVAHFPGSKGGRRRGREHAELDAGFSVPSSGKS